MIRSQHLIKLELHAGRLTFAGADNDVPGDPGIAHRAGFEESSAAKVVAGGIDRATGGQRGDDVRRTVPERVVADIDQPAVVSPQRVARFKLGDAVAA